MEALLSKIESYGFECEAGPLALCVDWQKLKVHVLLATAQPAAEPVAWMNVKYGTFFGAGVIAQTDRNDDLIASGELIRLYAHPAQPAAVPVVWIDNSGHPT